MLRKLDIRKWSRKQQLISAGVVVLLIAVAVTLSLTVFRQREAAESDQLQTARVRQGDLVIYASGSGTLTAGHQYELGFAASGPVAELNVQAGDTVEAGDAFAVQGEREQLQASVAADQLSLLDAQKALDDLYDTAAQAEIDALYDQIEGTMTAEQVQAIAEMNPTQEDIAALMESLGLDNANAAGGFQGGNPPQGFNPDDLPEGFSPGNFPGGGQMGSGGDQGQGPGGGNFGGDIDPETLATMEARREEMGGSFRNRANLFLVEPLIELLEERAAS
jgi:hypothetical protein